MVNPGPVRSSGSMTWVRYSLMSTTLPRPKATPTQCLPATCATPAIVPLIRTRCPADSSARPPTSMSNGSPAFRPLATTVSTAVRSLMVAISASAKSCAITCCSTHVGEGEPEKNVHIKVGLARFPGEGALDQVHPRGSASPLQQRRGQDRHLHRGGGGRVVAADCADQHASRALALQAAVVMREVFGAEREVGLAQELGVLVAVRIEGAGDEGVAAHDLAHAAGDVGLGPSHAAHAHRAVEGEIDAVPCPAVLELGEHAAEKVLVCLRRDPA